MYQMFPPKLIPGGLVAGIKVEERSMCERQRESQCNDGRKNHVLPGQHEIKGQQMKTDNTYPNHEDKIAC